MRGASRPTIRDVAREARVSTATVSYVLNETPGQTIRDGTRERVREAATRLGYLPHAVARTLREGTARVVIFNTGPVVIGESLNGFIRGMADELRALGHALIVTTPTESAGGAVPREVLDAVAPRAVLDLASLLSDSVADDRVSGEVGGAHVGFAFQSSQQLRYLADRGHRQIAFASLTPATELTRIREAQAARAADALGLELSIVRLDADDDHDAWCREVDRLARHTAVTAVAAYDDDVAIAVLAAMAATGLRAPDDLAVIGFDEGKLARLWRPALTTFRIDAESYGRRAARIALGLDPGHWHHSPSQVVIRETA